LRSIGEGTKEDIRWGRGGDYPRAEREEKKRKYKNRGAGWEKGYRGGRQGLASAEYRKEKYNQGRGYAFPTLRRRLRRRGSEPLSYKWSREYLGFPILTEIKGYN